MNARRLFSIILAVVTTLGGVSVTRGVEPPPPTASAALAAGDEAGLTPPRLSYTDGEVSFWRPGAQDWTAAQINIPLVPNDELYTGPTGTLEVQIGTRAFARGWADTQLGLVNQEPDFLQIKVTAGHASLDVRMLEPGRTIELDTPHAAFTIEQTGYYRVDVTQDRTQLVTRRGGRATMIPPGGAPMAIAPSEELVVEGLTSPRVEAYVAPELDTWDRWNYARTDELIDSVSTRYVSSGVYGVDDLDHYGTWRVVPTYGSIWVPDNVPGGWVPYSTGSWVWDPHYGWTWVDTAPWGWAPYHYGRWVFVNGFWAWAPGPPVVRAAYAPALVVFFGGGSSIRVASGPAIAWCALGWGEPLVPWWGRRGFVGSPWWGGWGGPRVVNNVVVRNTTIVNVQNITVYQNATVHQAVVAVDRDHFGRRPVRESRATAINAKELRPVRGTLQVEPTPASFVPEVKQAPQPPREILAKPVVATRAPQPARAPAAVTGDPAAGGAASPRSPVPAPRLVSPPKSANPAIVSPRPPLGSSSIERPRPSLPPPPGEPQHHPPAAVQGGQMRQPGEPAARSPIPGGPAASIPPRAPHPEPGNAEPQRPAPQVTSPAPAAPPEMRRPGPPEIRPEPARPEPRPSAPSPQAPSPTARPAPEGRQRTGTLQPPTTAPNLSVPPQAPPPVPSGPRPEPVRPEPRRAAPAPAIPPQVTPAPEVKPEPGRSRPAPPQAPLPAPSQVRPEPPRPEPRVTAPAPGAPPQAARPAPPSAPPAVTRPAPREGRPEPPRPAAPSPQSPALREGPPSPPAPALPGEPANRLYPGRSDKKSPGSPINAQQGAPNAPASREQPGHSRG